MYQMQQAAEQLWFFKVSSLEYREHWRIELAFLRPYKVIYKEKAYEQMKTQLKL